MGRDMAEGLQIAGLLEQAGYDALDADVGCYDSWYWNHPPMYFATKIGSEVVYFDKQVFNAS